MEMGLFIKRNMDLFVQEEQNELYQKLFMHHPDGVFSLDLFGRIQEANAPFAKQLGCHADELIQTLLHTYVYKEDVNRYNSFFKKVTNGATETLQVALIHKNGKQLFTELTFIPVRHNDHIIHIYGFSKQIKNHLKAVVPTEERYRSMFLHNSEGINSFDLEGNYIEFNPAMEQLLGYSAEEIASKPFAQVIHPDYLEKTWAHFKKASKGIPQNYDIVGVHKDGHFIDVNVTNAPITVDGKIVGVYGFVRDITELKKVADLNTFLAYHDPLTNLANRRMFEKWLDEALIVARTCQQKLAVMYVDLDRFKYINDSLGHDVGDQLLLCVAERLRQTVSEKDLVARIGGDEFMILLPMVTNVDQSVLVAERIRAALEEPFMVEEYELFITSSVGISLYPNDGDDRETLIKSADAALYRAKEQGKNTQQVYSSTMNIQTYKTFSLEKDLRKAIHQGELELYYQPKVETMTGQIVGAEALVRWHHPEWGLVSPDEFIPLAEESGLIIPLSNYVIEMACRQNKAWQQAGLPPLPISVNISAQQFLQKDMVKHLQDVLTATHLDPCWLELEITENSLLHNGDSVVHTLNQLKGLGVKIAIDDFGTGYSSLAYLKSFHIDTLKIDKSFIQALTEDVKDAKITAAMTHLAKSLGISVVAEGVEKMEQLHFLQKINCDQIQGFIFSKPVPVADFTKLLTREILPINRNVGTPGAMAPNLRKFFRLDLYFPLSAQMTIIQIKGRAIDLGETEVLIENLGPGGLCFLATVKLAINREIILEFETVIMDKRVVLQGVVVWAKEIENGIYQYGIEFTIVEGERSNLAQVLNEFSLMLRKSPWVPNCSLIKMDRFNYLKSKRD